MIRTHLVTVSWGSPLHPFETRLLIQINSSRLAALSALYKLCPEGQLTTPLQASPIGLSVQHDAVHYTVSFVQSVKPVDVAVLCRYYPVLIPEISKVEAWANALIQDEN